MTAVPLPARWEPREGLAPGPRVRVLRSRWALDEAHVRALRDAGSEPVGVVPDGPAEGPWVLLTMDREGVEGHGTAWVSEDYVAALHAVGARVFLVPPGAVDVGALLGAAAAVVVTGGAFDIDPRVYGAEITARHDGMQPTRTATELALCRAALAADRPFLGVCGGHQLLAVALGGTLIQDLPADPAHEQPTDPGDPWHDVHYTGELAAWWGPTGRVNSTHHQAILDPGPTLHVEGRSPDGVIEAVRSPHHRYVVGVQSHPERQGDLRPYAGLVAAARAIPPRG